MRVACSKAAHRLRRRGGHPTSVAALREQPRRLRDGETTADRRERQLVDLVHDARLGNPVRVMAGEADDCGDHRRARDKPSERSLGGRVERSDVWNIKLKFSMSG